MELLHPKSAVGQPANIWSAGYTADIEFGLYTSQIPQQGKPSIEKRVRDLVIGNSIAKDLRPHPELANFLLNAALHL